MTLSMGTIDISKNYDLGELMGLVSVQLRSLHIFLSIGLVEEAGRQGLKLGTIAALSLIDANPGIFQNDAGSAIGIDRSTMVEVVDLLSERNWVRRIRSSEDRRRYELHTTAIGSEALRNIVSSVKKREMDILRNVPENEIQQFTLLLSRMRAECFGRFQVPDHADGPVDPIRLI